MILTKGGFEGSLFSSYLRKKKGRNLEVGEASYIWANATNSEIPSLNGKKLQVGLLKSFSRRRQYR